MLTIKDYTKNKTESETCKHDSIQHDTCNHCTRKNRQKYQSSKPSSLHSKRETTLNYKRPYLK